MTAGVTCTGCGAHVTVRGLDQCPICRIPIAPIVDARITPNAPPPTPSPSLPLRAGKVKMVSAPMSGKDWFAIITISVIVIFVCLIIYRVIVPSSEKLHDRAVGAALLNCQQTIKLTAQYGDAETPPYAKNYGKGDEFYFAWPRGSFEFTNGFGAREKMSASCIGVISTGEIKQLTINAKDIM